MKVGDEVMVHDGSYSITINQDRLLFKSGIDLKKEFHTILAIGQKLSLPTSNHNDSNTEINNLVIQGNSTGEITFIHRSNCGPAYKTFCPYCGHKVTLCACANSYEV